MSSGESIAGLIQALSIAKSFGSVSWAVKVIRSLGNKVVSEKQLRRDFHE